MKLGTALFAAKENYRLIVIGGGTGGCAVASKFARHFPKQQIAVIEPQTNHFYQPGLTLAAAGLMPHQKLVRNEFSVLPRGVDWHRIGVDEIVPNQNKITLADGKVLSYEFLVISTGIELRYDLIEGLAKGRQSLLDVPNICSIYFPEGARKTQALINAFPKGGTALFTFPNTPIKCAGAPQKILYLAEEIFRNRMVRERSQVIYCTSLPRIFGVPKYADSLMKIIGERNIELQTRLNLCKVDPAKMVATFQVLDENSKDSGERREFEYNFLHIGPPCSAVPLLRKLAQSEEGSEKRLTDPQGFVKVDPKTLQSPAFPNVFAIGDCANTPNAKTAAAISSQLRAMSQHLRAAMEKRGEMPKIAYDGYASCPLVVDRKHAILAEFNPQGPLETFPFDQSKPSKFAFFLKLYAMPPLYWHFLVKGHWQGPSTIRKMLHPFEWFKKAKK